MPDLFGGIRAPSTLGSHLRSFTWGNVRRTGDGEPPAAGRAGPSGAAAARPGAAGLRQYRRDAETGLGAPQAGRRVRAWEETGKSLLLRGLNALAATVCTPLGAPMAVRRRPGCTAGTPSCPPAARPGAAAEAIGTARDTGCSGLIMVPGGLLVLLGRVLRRGPPGRRPGLGHGEHGCQGRRGHRRYRRGSLDGDPLPRAIWDDQSGCWVSDAQVAGAEPYAGVHLREEVRLLHFAAASWRAQLTPSLTLRMRRVVPAGEDPHHRPASQPKTSVLTAPHFFRLACHQIAAPNTAGTRTTLAASSSLLLQVHARPPVGQGPGFRLSLS